MCRQKEDVYVPTTWITVGGSCHKARSNEWMYTILHAHAHQEPLQRVYFIFKPSARRIQLKTNFDAAVVGDKGIKCKLIEALVRLLTAQTYCKILTRFTERRKLFLKTWKETGNYHSLSLART